MQSTCTGLRFGTNSSTIVVIRFCCIVSPFKDVDVWPPALDVSGVEIPEKTTHT